jgi:signal transduction histidine kinase
VEEGQYEVPARVRGEERYFDLQFSPLRNRRGQFVGRLIVARDITERKHAEDEIKLRTHQVEEVNRRLEAANEELRYLSQIKDEFVSNVSHELRTPITILKLNEEFLRMRPDKWEIYLERIERETGRLERIIEDLLRLSRIDQERVDFDPQPLDLNAFIEQYVEDRAVLADRKSIQLTCEKMPDLPPILADKGLMGQVLSILLTNALNYTPSQGSVAVKTQLRQQDGRQWAGFYVKDSGPGIPASEQGQLFERFFRGSVGRNSGEAGTGLGLAIAREIVIRHNGIIEMESTGIPGEGATFWVWLPLQNSLIPVKEPVP